MPSGPGKYDPLCTYVREQTRAKAAIVIIVGGEKGSGFSVQCAPNINLALPTLLRATADEIEKVNGGGRS